MSPLVFLMTRRFVNVFRRAFHNPGRTVATLVVAALLLLAYGGPLFLPSTPSYQTRTPFHIVPPLDLISAILTLLVFGFLVLSFEVGVNFTSAFSDSDVSVVLPTPLPRRLVFHFTTLSRGLLGSLFGSFVVAYFLFTTSRSLLGGMPGEVSMRNGVLGAGGFVVTLTIANAALLQMGILCGMNVFDGRIRKGVLHVVSAVVIVSFIGALFVHTSDWDSRGFRVFETMVRRVALPPASWIFLPFRGIADCSLILLRGWTPAILPALLLWIGLLFLGFELLGRRSLSMYEYAIHLARGHALRKEMFRRNAFSLKIGSGSKRQSRETSPRSTRWAETWSPVGGTALFWRNLLLIRRFGGFLIVKIHLSVTLFTGIAVEVLRVVRPGTQMSAALTFAGMTQFILMFIYVPSSVAWLSQSLSRFEIQKPFPISSRRAVLAELLTPSLAVAGSNLFGLFVFGLLFPPEWKYLFAGYLCLVSGFVIMSCLMFIVLLFNPDQNDTLQRMLFGFAQVILLVISFLPSGIILGGGLALGISPGVLGILVVLFNGACAGILLGIAAKKYESLNPAE